MSTVSRRQFQQRTLGSLLTFSLLESVFAADAFSAPIRPVTAAWLADLDAVGRDLKGKKLTQRQWQEKVESLLSQADLPELLKFIDFEKLKQAGFKDRGEKSVRFRFPEVEDLPTKLVFGHQMFALQQGRSVAPHGHNNMATAFLILEGEFHGRHYDRLEDEKESFIIRPTIDRQFGVGEYSTITDEKDNVHWFTASSQTGYIFNIHLLSVKPGRTGRVYLDPNGERISGGRIRARRLNAKQAYELYG